jgi:hypothetical protein
MAIRDEKVTVASDKQPVVSVRPQQCVILLDAWGVFPEGKVLASDPDLISHFDKDGVRYRVATDQERRIGGFVE